MAGLGPAVVEAGARDRSSTGCETKSAGLARNSRAYVSRSAGMARGLGGLTKFRIVREDDSRAYRLAVIAEATELPDIAEC